MNLRTSECAPVVRFFKYDNMHLGSLNNFFSSGNEMYHALNWEVQF
jgi:hypothetical protein